MVNGRLVEYIMVKKIEGKKRNISEDKKTQHVLRKNKGKRCKLEKKKTIMG
jgi:hypothetical protein